MVDSSEFKENALSGIIVIEFVLKFLDTKRGCEKNYVILKTYSSVKAVNVV